MTCVVRLSIWHFGRRQNVTAIDSTICRWFSCACASSANGDVNSTGGRTLIVRDDVPTLYAVRVITTTDVINFFRATLRFQRNSIAIESTHWSLDRHLGLFRSCLRLRLIVCYKLFGNEFGVDRMVPGTLFHVRFGILLAWLGTRELLQGIGSIMHGKYFST